MPEAIAALLAQQMHVGERGELRYIDAMHLSDEDERILRAGPREVGDQFQIEPIGDGSVVANDGLGNIGEQIGGTRGSEEFEVRAVAGEYRFESGCLLALEEFLRGDYKNIALLGKAAFIGQVTTHSQTP